jgi:GNAT superfamily N-acetyltransferase
MDIRTATRQDLKEVLDWLHQEAATTGHSFACNKSAITRAFEYRTLKVARRDGQSIGFLLDPFASRSKDRQDSFKEVGIIMAVRPDLRNGGGVGRHLAEHLEKSARRRGQCILAAEIASEEAVPFWRRMGWEIHGEPENAGLDGTKEIVKPLAMPTSGRDVQVEFEFYGYGGWKQGYRPMFSITAEGRRLGNTVHMHKRTPIHHHYRGFLERGTLRVLVEGDRVLLHRFAEEFDGYSLESTSPVAALGVKKDLAGHFFIEKLRIPG